MNPGGYGLRLVELEPMMRSLEIEFITMLFFLTNIPTVKTNTVTMLHNLGLSRNLTIGLVILVGAWVANKQMSGGRMTTNAWLVVLVTGCVAWCVHRGDLYEGYRNDYKNRAIIKRNVIDPFLTKAEGDALLEKTLPNRDYGAIN